MTRKAKLLERLENRRCDNTWTFSEVETLLTRSGYVLRPGKGSHYIFQHPGDGQDITIPRHHASVKPGYIALIRKNLLK